VVPYELLDATPGVRSINRSPLYPLNVACTHVKIALVADLPAMGSCFLQIERAGGVAAAPAEVENEFFRVEPVPGGVRILDKATGEVVHHGLEDGGDRGDEYNFCPVEGETPAWLGAWDHEEATRSGRTVRLKLRGTWAIPRGLAGDRRARLGTVEVPVALEVALHDGLRRVDFTLDVDNAAEDHRLRAAFRLPQEVTATRADTAFGWVERASAVPTRDWPETPMGTFPMVGQVHVGELGVAAVGIHEYEAVGDTLYLTLLRCVGWLSRDDLSTRQGDAGPMVPAPGAQCLGHRRFRYAWLSGADRIRQGDAFLVPPVGFPTATAERQAPVSLLEIDQPAWRFSALKRAEAGDGLVLRVYNNGAEPATGTIGGPFKVVGRARLDETPLPGAPSFTLGPYEIATFLLEG
jgi:alpha-mannosidase